MIYRKKYIDEIRPFYDSDLIKIITGVRRCGKSVVMEQIRDELSEKSGNIIYLDFDDRAETADIRNWEDIVSYVNNKRSEGFCYVLLDEIQEVDGWQYACRSLRRENCSVFITGSNSKLLSKEFTKELSGRYVSFQIRPFVYRELEEYAGQLGKEVSVTDYLIWGGFPKRLEYDDEKVLRRYLYDLNDTIVYNDIIQRYGIKKIDEFKKTVDFLLISNARQYSSKAISDTMKSNGIDVTSNTVQKWIGYLSEAYVIDEISKYSRKAKRKLDQSKKVYNTDVSLNSIRVTDGRYDLSHNMENVVYNELLYEGYALSVYENYGREIDFLAEKDGKKYYIQVALSVAEQKAYDREFSAFGNLSQIDRMILITNDELDYSTSNVTHIRLKDFLVNGIR